MAEAAPAAVTRDRFLGGLLVLDQPARGHRAGTDAVLLAASVPRDFAGLLYDVGAGAGLVGLGVAATCPAASVRLIENDAASVVLADRNVALNGLTDRVSVVACDILCRAARRARLSATADLVVTNPPFYRPDRVRASPDANRRAAHVGTATSGLEAWLLACLACLGAKGTLILIHTAEAVPEIVAVLDGRLGDLTLMTIHPRAGQPATRALVRGVKGSRAPFRAAWPLVLHEGDGFTTRAAALHAGAARLDW